MNRKIFIPLLSLISAFAQVAKAEAPAPNAIGKVYFEFQRPEFPSCEVVAGRIRNTKVRISEIENLVKLLARKRNSSQEIESLRAVSREYLESILDAEDLEVKLTVEWKASLVAGLPADLPANLPANLTAEQFHFFKINGPGLAWHSVLSSRPDFLSLQFTGEFARVSYRISTLDFCFGERNLVLQGRAPASSQSASLEYDVENARYDRVLNASWIPDVKRPEQEIFAKPSENTP